MPTSAQRRFWTGYAAAWLPPFAIYFFAFHLDGRSSTTTTVLASLVNIAPDALLGIGVVLAGRASWSHDPPRASLARLALLALVFVALTTWIKVSLAMLIAARDGIPTTWATYDRRLLLWQAFLCAISFSVIATATYARCTSERLRREATRRADAELLRTRSELKALRAQFNPHFLSNTLHSVRALIREAPAAAEEALEQLGDLLRYALRVQDAAEEGVLFDEEWEFVSDFIQLERLRLGERLKVEAEIDERAREWIVPAFVLQPLVENSIRHAIAPRAHGGTIWIRARVENDALQLEVRDDGPGTSEASTRGSGRGLDLVRQRLHALYGVRGTLETRARAGEGFLVSVRLPDTLESP